MSEQTTLPERPAVKSEEAAPASQGAGDGAEGAEGGEKLSKKALKKLEKEREKVTGRLFLSRWWA